VRYAEATKGIEKATRKELEGIVRTMAYQLMVVEPGMRRRLVSMHPGAEASRARDAVARRLAERGKGAAPSNDESDA
jgi:hypothetical protein